MFVEFFQKVFLAFIPLFVAMDPLGLVPLFLSLTHTIEKSFLKKIVWQAIFTAAGVAVLFVFLGKGIFEILGIGVGDFKIAGGLILLGLAVRELIGGPNEPKLDHDDIGVVPLGMPLIAGPATITSLLILIDSQGVIPTLVALLLNLIIVYLAFRFSDYLKRAIGLTGLRALSKIIAMLLAAIAVNMIRKGLQVI